MKSKSKAFAFFSVALLFAAGFVVLPAISDDSGAVSVSGQNDVVEIHQGETVSISVPNTWGTDADLSDARLVSAPSGSYTVSCSGSTVTVKNTSLPVGSTYTLETTWYIWEAEDSMSCNSCKVKSLSPAVVNYTVSFNSNGGTAVSSQTVSAGGYVSQPAAPNNGVKIFGGWYTDQACTQAYNFSTPVNSSFMLYAKWTDPTVAITSGHGNDSMKIGDLFEYYITTNPSGASISVTGASWLHVDDHRIYGTPTTAGTYNVTINATSNGYNPAAQSFTITVSSILAPSNSPSNGAIAYVR